MVVVPCEFADFPAASAITLIFTHTYPRGKDFSPHTVRKGKNRYALRHARRLGALRKGRGELKRIIGAGRAAQLKGRWQLIVTIEDTETGRKTEKTELTDIRCSASTNLGRASATEALERFRAQVAAATGAHLRPSGSARTASGPCGKTLVEGIGEYIEYRRVTGGISPTTADAYGYSLLHIKRGFPSQLPGEDHARRRQAMDSLGPSSRGTATRS